MKHNNNRRICVSIKEEITSKKLENTVYKLHINYISNSKCIRNTSMI